MKRDILKTVGSLAVGALIGAGLGSCGYQNPLLPEVRNPGIQQVLNSSLTPETAREPDSGLEPIAEDSVDLPDGVSRDWWSQVRNSIRDSEYRIRETAPKKGKISDARIIHQAANPRHNLTTYFNDDGIRVVPGDEIQPGWEWGLQLKGYGGPGNIRPVPVAEKFTDGNRIEYRRGNITEWYINDSRGLEQGFTIEREIESDSAEIVVELAVSGSLAPRLNRGIIEFSHPELGHKLNYDKLIAWDVNHNTLDSRFELSDGDIQIVVNTTDAVYPIVIDPLTSGIVDSRIVYDRAGAGFGSSMSSSADVNGDGYSDLVVYVANYDAMDGNGIVGAMFVYAGSVSGLGTTPEQTIVGIPFAGLGAKLADAGDVNGDGYADLVAGVSNYDPIDGNGIELTDAGAVFVYFGDANGLNPTPQRIDGEQEDSTFASSVSSAGDVDGDGYSDVVVGAFFYDTIDGGGAVVDRGGAIFLYQGSATGLDPVAQQIDSGQAVSRFGTSVSSAGDVNSDGFSDVIVGAWWYNTVSGGFNAGAAFLYMGSAGGLNPTAIQFDSGSGGENFGIAVSNAGDVNGDGYGDFVVGAERYDDNVIGNLFVGAVFVYFGSNTGVNPSPQRIDGNGALGLFGKSVSHAGDVNGDGYSDIVVDDQTDTHYLHLGGAGGLDAVPILIDGSSENTVFVFPTGAGDINGDGFNDLVIGAPGYNTVDENGTALVGAGAVFTMLGSTNGLITTEQRIDGDQASAWHGISVSSGGDVDGDGFDEIVVAAPYYSPPDGGGGFFSEAGAIFVYPGNAGGTIMTPQLIHIGQDNAHFGGSVSSAGDINGDGYGDVVVGAPEYDTTAPDAGAFFLYLGSPGGLNTPPQQFDGDQTWSSFSRGVTSAGDVNDDGFDDVLISQTGLVYLHLGSAGGLGPVSQQFDGDGIFGIGIGVSSSGDVNSDGYDDVVFGAQNTVLLHFGSDTGLNPIPLQLDDVQPGSGFGSSVSIPGDINGDGYQDVAVSAPGYDTVDDNGVVLINAGAILIYFGDANGLTTTPQLLDGQLPSGSIGGLISGLDDVNGDGYDDLIVGNAGFDPLDENGVELANAGAIFIYQGGPGGLNPAPQRIDGDQVPAQLGYSVSGGGDFNGDGYQDVLAGAPFYDAPNGGGGFIADTGAAYLYLSSAPYLAKPEQLDSADNPVSLGGAVTDELKIRMVATPHLSTGYSRVKLQTVACPLGASFDDPLCITETSGAWVDVTDVGVPVELSIFPRDGATHWRSHLLYISDTTITANRSDVVSPWLTPDATASNVDVYFSYGSNQDPTISGTPSPTSLTPYQNFNFIPVADDMNSSDTLVFSILNQPPWASFDTATGELDGTPRDNDYGVYGNIVISVADDFGASAALPAFSIEVTDVAAPSVQSGVVDNGDGRFTVSLTCFDAGSGCNGAIYYTTDGTDPSTPGTRSLYNGSFSIADPSVIRTFSADTAGNASGLQLAQFVTVDTPVNGFIGNIAVIDGSFDESLQTIVSVQIEVEDALGNALIEQGGLQQLVPTSPPRLATVLDTGNDTWSYPLQAGINWVSERGYTIKAIATDASGNQSTVTNGFTYFPGAAIPTTLTTNLLKTSIEVNGTLDVQATLKRDDNPNFDFSGQGYELLLKAEYLGPSGSDVPVAAGERSLGVAGTGLTLFDEVGSGAIQFGQAGFYELWVEFAGNPILQGRVTDRQGLSVGSAAGYAVIIEGKLGNNEGLSSHHKTTLRIYDTLRKRGFANEDIEYFSYFPSNSIVDGIPDKVAIGNAIAALAAKVNAKPADVYVFMIDHGGIATGANETSFFLDDEVITPTDLDVWLTGLENGLTDASLTKRIAVVGSCYSGGFVDRVSGANRVVVSSASANEQSFKGPVEADGIRTGELFVEFLLDELVQGANLKNAFNIATIKTETETTEGQLSANAALNENLDQSIQHPLLDDNGDGEGTNALFDNGTPGVSLDGQVAAGIKLGFDRETDVNAADILARITGIPGPVYLDSSTGTAQLSLVVNDDNLVSAAYAEIRVPGKTLEGAPLGTSEQITTEFDRQGFSQSGAADTFSLDYDRFDDPGIYEIHYYVNDLTGPLATAPISLVYKDDVANANTPTTVTLEEPADGADINGQATIFDWSDSSDADGDEVSYTFSIADTQAFDSFTRSNDDGSCSTLDRADIQYGLPISSTFIDLQNRLCPGNTYYWRIEAVDPFGKHSTSAVRSFSTLASNPAIGVIVAMVQSNITQQLLAGLDVFDASNAANKATAVSNQLYNGNYVLFIDSPAGTYTVSAEDQTNGAYVSQDIDNVQVQSGQTREIGFRLAPDGTVDSDGDGIFDINDLCPLKASTDNRDFDGDGAGNVCDNDDDDDGMLDSYENQHGLDPRDASDASLDNDGDGFSNFVESLNDTDPNSFDLPQMDKDGDGVFDSNDNCKNTINQDQSDNDADGKGDVCDMDDDDDGMPDSFEVLYNFDPFDAADAAEDADDDGLTNLEEFEKGSSPVNPEEVIVNQQVVVEEVVEDDGGSSGSAMSHALLVLFFTLMMLSALSRKIKRYRLETK